MRNELYSNSRRVLQNAIKNFVELVPLGYTHENFSAIAYYFELMGKHLGKNELSRLEACWSNSYTDSCDEEELFDAVEEVRLRYSLD